MFTISSLKTIENKHDVYRGKDCMKQFCEFLGEHAMEIINFTNNKMKLLTNGQQKSYENATFATIVKKNLKMNMLKSKII